MIILVVRRMKKKKIQSHELKDLVNPLYPNLINRIRQIIEDSEKSFSENKSVAEDSFLWEHTFYVSAIARMICQSEGLDPLLPVIAALFHDIGKFADAKYHPDDTPEEQIAAQLAGEILGEENMEEAQIREIVSGLEALYEEKKTGNLISDIVHDSDFLAKFGYLGIANFFSKSALRGQNLKSSLTGSLSKELTYASVLPKNMRTSSGKKMALQKRRDTLNFYKALLQELRNQDIAYFKIKETTWSCPRNSQKSIKIFLVLPDSCPDCGEELISCYSSQEEIKCTKLIADIRCKECPQRYRISFCLPEIIS